MPQPTIEELKRVLTATRARREAPPFRRLAGPPGRAQASTLRREADGLLRSFVTKAGLDVAKLDQIREQIRRDEQDAFAKFAAEAAKHADRDRQALRHGIEGKRKAYEALKAPPFLPPAGPSLIVLDRPFLIWQMPQEYGSEFIDSSYGSMDSSAKFTVETSTGSQSTQIIFYFWWVNDSDFLAVVNVDTSLILNGVCEVGAGTGFFSGDSCFLDLTAQLALLEWWDQTSGQPAQPMPESTQTMLAASLSASGGGIFSSPVFKSQMFINDPFDLSYTMFAVPGNSGVLFEVSLVIEYAFTSGGLNISDLILVDFATGANSIICPSVNLTLLTAPPGAARK